MFKVIWRSTSASKTIYAAANLDRTTAEMIYQWAKHDGYVPELWSKTGLLKSPNMTVRNLGEVKTVNPYDGYAP
ncbi:MAG TPA: hypothetical protein VFR24_27585 [Candidatus Angelobacter sp.]|nr:hypothetical protein [Candidatus Angelobacter sp.]